MEQASFLREKVMWGELQSLCVLETSGGSSTALSGSERGLSRVTCASGDGRRLTRPPSVRSPVRLLLELPCGAPRGGSA